MLQQKTETKSWEGVLNYKKYLLMLLLSVFFVYLLNNSYVLVKGKVVDYFNRNQVLLAQQASIGLKDRFLRYAGELAFLAEMEGVWKMDADGRQLLRNYLKRAGEDIMGITRVDSKGVIIFTIPDETAIGRDISSQSHMVYILKKMLPVLSDVFLAVQNFQTVAYHVPVFDGEGMFQGTLALLINFEGLSRTYIDQIETGSDGNAWILSQNGSILYAKDARMLERGEGDGRGPAPYADLKKRMLAGEEGVKDFLTTEADQNPGKRVRHWAAFTPLSIENTFWSIAVSTPQSEIFKTMAMIEKSWMKLLLILGLVGLIFIYSVVKARTLHQEEKKREKIIKSLEWERAFTNKALDAQLDTFFVFDLKQRKAVRWNRRFRDVSGYNDQEIAALDEPFPNLAGEDIPRAGQAISETLQNGIGRTEITLRCKNGRLVPTEYHLSTLSDDGGAPEFLIAIGRDISERRKAESAVLENQRLGVIGEMAAAVAHDFNNSLQMLLGNLELALEETKQAPAVQKRLKTMHQVTSDAAVRVQMIQRLGGKKGIKNKYGVVDVAGLLADVIVQTRPLWKDSMEKNGWVISMKTRLNETPPVMGNASELRVVFHNVVKNAIEAMPRGGEIMIVCQADQGLVRVTIQDSGKGMSEEVRQRVFQPFFSTKGYELGRGLGLSGAYTIIKEHGGEIWIKSTEPGRGTEVEITIPLTTQAMAELPSRTKEKKPRHEVTILWVDDEEMIREIGFDMLSSLGHRGDFAENGAEALAMLENHPYDLVITDVGMPGMSGWVLARKIREQYGPAVKVAIVTGWGEVESQDEMAEFIDFFLQKPVAYDQVKRMIEEAGGM